MRLRVSHFAARRIVVRRLCNTLLALGTSTMLLASCHRTHDDDDQHPNDGGPLAVNQYNSLKGATRDVTVRFTEGTNMAAAPSPDGKRIVFSAQGALWIMPVSGGDAIRITGWELEPTAPVWSPDSKRIAFQNYSPEGISTSGRSRRKDAMRQK